MTHTCCHCRFWDPGDVDAEMGGRVGECTLARKWGGKVMRPWGWDACKSFERKEEERR